MRDIVLRSPVADCLFSFYSPCRSLRDSDPEEGDVQSVVRLKDLLHGPDNYGNTCPREYRLPDICRIQSTPGYISHFLLPLPVQVLFATVFSAITYFMTEQPMEWNRFLKVVVVYILTAVMADSFGTFLGTLITPVVSTRLDNVVCGWVGSCCCCCFQSREMLIEKQKAIETFVRCGFFVLSL